MKIICPGHKGLIHITGRPVANIKNLTIENLVVECPVCDEEVLINGVFDYDEYGIPISTDVRKHRIEIDQ